MTAQNEQIIALCRSGMGEAKIALAMGVPAITVRRFIKENGGAVKIRGRSLRKPAGKRFTQLEKARAARILIEGGEFSEEYPELRMKVLNDWATTHFGLTASLLSIEQISDYIDEIEAKDRPAMLRVCKAYNTRAFTVCGAEFDSEGGKFHLCPSCRGSSFDRYGL